MASNSSRNVNLAIIGEDLTRAATDSAGRNFSKLQDQVDGLGKSGSRAGNDFSKGLQDAIDRSTPTTVAKFRDMGGKAGKAGGRNAGDEFIRGLPFGIGKGAIGIGKVVVALFDKLAPEAAKEAGIVGAKAGEALAGSMASAASSAAQDVPALFSPEGAIGAAIVAVIAGSLAPLAGAAVAAAVTGAIGIGFLGIGALILKNNPVIVSALSSLKASAGRVFKDAASPLIVPFTTAIDIIQLKMQSLGPSFKQIFSSLAPVVAPLTTAFADIVAAFTPGLVKNAQTFADVFTDPDMLKTIETLGPDIDAFFTTVSKHKQLIIDFFKLLIGTIDVVIGAINVLINVAGFLDTAFHTTTSSIGKGFTAAKGVAIEAFSAMSSVVLDVLGGIVNGAAKAFGWVPGLGGKLKDAAKGFNTFRDQVNAALAGIKDQTVTVNVKVNAPKGLTNVTHAAHASTFAAAPGWAPLTNAASSSNTTEAARPINVDNHLSATLQLDGKVLASLTDRRIAANNRRRKVGVR